jgi:predicted ATPase
MQVFIDGRSYRLNNLGAGLAQFIVVLGNAAVLRPNFILIDEPELNLHPTLQLDFLTTLGSFAKNGVFFATHSYGLSRSSAELIYSVHRGPDGLFRLTNSGPVLAL